MKKLLFILLSSICVFGCKDSAKNFRIDKQKARIIMDDISRRNLAYETLTEQDEAMMQHVVEYYNKYGTSNNKTDAYYLLGSVYSDLHDAPKSMEEFLDGINAADTTSTDCRYDILARLYGQKSDLLRKQSLNKLALEAEKMVYRSAVLAKDSIYMVAAQWGILGKLFALEDYQTIADKCWEVLENSKNLGAYSYSTKHLCTAVLANTELGRIEDAQKLLSIYEQHSNCVDLTNYECSFPIYYYAKGKVLTAMGQLDSAVYFFRKELCAPDWNNRQAAYRGLRMAFDKKGETDSLCKYAALQCDAVDSAYQEMLMQNLQTLHELYDYNRLQKENIQKEQYLQESRRMTQYTWYVLIVIIIFFVFLFVYLRSWYKQKIATAELTLERANAALDEQESNIATLQNELANVSDNKEKVRLTEEVEQAEKEANKQRKVVILNQEELDNLRQRIKSTSKSLRQQYCQTPLFLSLKHKVKTYTIASEQDYELIENFLRDKDPDLLQRFHFILPKHSEMELRVFLMLRFGMTKTEISLLTARSQAAVTNICTRLFQKAHGKKCSTSAEANDWLLKL